VPDYRIMYKGRNWPSDKDGLNVALAVYRDGEYFQFFIGSVPADEVPNFGLGEAAQPSLRWYQALAQATIEAVRAEIEAGYKPSKSKHERTTAYFVWPDLVRLREIERSSEPHVTLDNDVFGGQELTTFTIEAKKSKKRGS
jgi:hypothetical protein